MARTTKINNIGLTQTGPHKYVHFIAQKRNGQLVPVIRKLDLENKVDYDKCTYQFTEGQVLTNTRNSKRAIGSLRLISCKA